MRPEKLIGEYQSLRAAYEAGQHSEEEFNAACDDLMAEDDEGHWWSVNSNGQLLFYDDAASQWVARAAPVSWSRKAPPPKPARVQSLGRSETKKSTPAKASKKEEPKDKPSPDDPKLAALAAIDPGKSIWNALAIVFFASLILSWVGWDILKIVPLTINKLIPTGGCTSFSPASIGMYFCSAFVGLRVVFGSLVLAVLLFFARKPITVVINRINTLLPTSYRSVMPAVLAALFFAIVWSGSHALTGGLWGILPHRAFPALVGVLVHFTMVFGPDFMNRHAGFFDARDRLSTLTRWVLVFIIPTGISLVITLQQRVSNEAFKQQFVVLVGMVVAFIIMTPRSGKLSDLARQGGKTGEAG